jgi:hypothetical protein
MHPIAPPGYGPSKVHPGFIMGGALVPVATPGYGPDKQMAESKGSNLGFLYVH